MPEIARAITSVREMACASFDAKENEASTAAAPISAPPAAADTGVPAGGDAVAVPGGAVAPTVAPPALPTSANEQRAYDAALDQFKRGDYAGAIAGFQSFVKSYPRSPLAASAQYWVGNAQFARKDYRSAIASQRQLIQLWQIGRAHV